MPDITISKFTFGDSTYAFKDAVAREALANINSFEYVVSTSASDTPYGIVWGNITGTLAASEGTMHKIYLVPSANAAGDLYDEYITIQNGNNFIWEKIGNTDIDLSGYLTAQEISNLYALKNNTVITGSLSLGRKANTVVGYNSVAEGEDNTASGIESHAEGGGTTASGSTAHAEGQGTTASGVAAHAEGSASTSTISYRSTTNALPGSYGVGTHSEGLDTRAETNGAHAEGAGTHARGDYSHAEGSYTAATGSTSHSEGQGTLSAGTASHTEGGGTTASGNYSHAEGGGTTATGDYSHAEGSGSTATGDYSHAEGGGTQTQGANSHAEGGGTTASGFNSHAEGGGTTASGAHAHAEGCNNGTFTRTGFGTVYPQAYGIASHVEGYATYANGDGAHAEGIQTIASEDYAHAEGEYGTASGRASHAEGSATTASAVAAHSEGGGCVASGLRSHAEGNGTVASGNDSHAGGSYTIANGTAMTAIGIYNVEGADCNNWAASTSYKVGDIVFKTSTYYRCITANSDSTFDSSKWQPIQTNTKQLFVVGNGVGENDRSNAFEVHADGTAYLDNTKKVITDQDYASASAAGVVKVNAGNGLTIDGTNTLVTAAPLDSQIQAGNNSYRPLVTSIQHKSVFYGLAKAAGDTSQSQSSNAVGTYTSAALAAIHAMLDIKPGVEVVRLI